MILIATLIALPYPSTMPNEPQFDPPTSAEADLEFERLFRPDRPPQIGSEAGVPAMEARITHLETELTRLELAKQAHPKLKARFEEHIQVFTADLAEARTRLAEYQAQRDGRN